MNDDNQNDNKGAFSQGLDTAKNAVSGAKSKAQGMQRIVKRATAKNAALKGVATVVKGFLIKLAIIILIIIFVVGIIAFFLTIPGMIMENLKKLVKALGDGLASWFGKGDETFVEKSQIYEVLDYLETMGYGLKEDGFLTDFVTSDISDGEVDKIISEKFDKDNGTMYVDTEQGVLRDDENKIIGAYSDFVMNYIISDNYMYTIRNFNVNTEHWYEALWDHFASIFSDSLSNRTGMITLYKANEDGTPSRNAYDSWEWGSIEINASSQTMKVQLLGLFDYNEPMEYSLEGWTGRYGMPLEFLLSVHAATMMPDLAYDMQNAFDTEVAVQLYESNGEAAAIYQGTNGDITYETLTQTMTGVSGRNIFSAIIAAIDNSYISSEEFNQVIELGLVPPCHKQGDDGTYECGCTVDSNKTAEVVMRDDGSGNIVPYPVKTEDYVENGETKTRKYIEYNGTKEVVSDSQITTKESFVVGDDCRAYLEYVMGMLGKENDYSYNTYIPYIEKVSNHWYRDVYFMISESDSDDLNIVDYDYDYESLVKERWTLYETWTKNENPELEGYQKLYEVLPGGELKDTPETDIKLYELGGVITDKDGNTVKRYVKKAVTNKVASIYDDYRWNHQNGYYSAYDFDQENSHSKKPLFTEEQIEQASSDLEKEAMKKMFIDVETETVLQTGDGMRAETNPLIKDMFVNNLYFRYDHDLEKAEAIVRLRKNEGVNYGPVYSESRGIDFRDKTTEIKDSNDPTSTKTITAEELAGHVELNSDNLAAFNMLENMHTLDADYIYRDFKELVVELGYFDKADLTDGTAELLEFPVPEIGSGGYPKRFLDKNEHTVGTLLHSKKDYDAIEANEGALIAAIQLLANEVSDEEYQARQTAGANNPPGSMEQQLYAQQARNDLYRAKQEIRALAGVNSTQYASVGAPEGGGPSKANLLSLDEWWEESQKMFDIYKGEGWTYLQDHSMGTFEEAHTTGHHTTDCSLNASWMLQKMGALSEGHTFSSHMGHTGTLDMSNVCAQELIDAGAEVIVPPDGTKFASAANSGFLEPGDTLFYDGHVSTYCGDSYKDYGKTFCWDTGSTTGIQAGGPRDTSYEDRDIELIIRLMPGKKESSDPYKGYSGNEAVVSPVTGILLDYGTYGTNDKNTKSTREIDNGDEVVTEFYRTNVDLKYGVESPFISGLDLEQTTDNTQTTENTEIDASIDETTDIYDRVGYAKILMLNQENFEKIDKAGTYWNVNGEHYNYVDKFSSPDEYNDYMKDEGIPDSEKNRVVTEQGYKEFLEDYADCGLDGYIVYIDGFLCETPDTELVASLGEEAENEMFKQQPSGDNKLTMDDFRINRDNLAASTEGEKPKMLNLYEPEKELMLASETATNKQNVEVELKRDAFPAMEVDGTIFIKEGTVLGRTMTDKELIEGTADGYEIRKNDDNGFDYYRVPEDQQGGSQDGTPQYNDDGTLKYEGDRVMGNYLRIQFFNREGENVENVEDYMKLDELGEQSQECEFEQLAYYLGCLEEGFYQSGDHGSTYGVEVLQDGAGNTTAFGLTSAVAELPTVQSQFPNFKSNLAAGEVPKEEAQDVFILVLEAAQETIEEKANQELDDLYLFALIDLSHASPSECYQVIDIFNANGTLTVADFENHWGTNMNYAAGLSRRGHNRGILATEGRWLLYQEGSQGDEVIFDTDTPWTEFCDGGGTYELITEASGFYHIKKGADNWVGPYD